MAGRQYIDKFLKNDPSSKKDIFNTNYKFFPYYFKQKRVVSFNNVRFGEIVDVEIGKNSNFWITDMYLKITLPRLLDTTDVTTDAYINANPNGYLNWVDNIGHAIINNFKMEISNTNGPNFVQFENDTFGRYLDVYNELNDKNLEEWSFLGKKTTVDSLKKYEGSSKIIFVPLHMFFSKDFDSALPLCLFKQKRTHYHNVFKKLF